jgi:S-adenosylmethionine-diacylglycerol 3-amino-3-carboxypropyl transferase
MKRVGYSLLKNIIMNKIDYYTCWEDFNIVQKALKPSSNDVIFSITSGGCNILNFLVFNPKEIVAVDYNPYQNYLLELKIEAIRGLEYAQFLQFVGVEPSNEREKLYGLFRKKMSDNARSFWDSNSYAIQKGILFIGEQNAKNLGKFLRFLKGSKTIEDFFHCRDITEQTDYFYQHIYGLPWRLYQKYTYHDWSVKLMLCLRAVREFHYRRKRAVRYFNYLQNVHYPPNHPQRIEEVFSRISLRDNHFASLMLLGYYEGKECFPPYLKAENYHTLQKNIDRIIIESISVAEALQKYSNEYFTKFNLSNIFDWMDDSSFQQQLTAALRAGKDGGKILYVTTRTDREIPHQMDTLMRDDDLASDLLREDRTIFFSHYYLGKIRK